MEVAIAECVIPAQSLGRTWDLPVGTPAATGCLLRSICLAPEHFILFTQGDVTGSEPCSWAVGWTQKDEWLVEVRGVGWPLSSGWSSLPATAVCVDFVVRSLPFLSC